MCLLVPGEACRCPSFILSINLTLTPTLRTPYPLIPNPVIPTPLTPTLYSLPLNPYPYFLLFLCTLSFGWSLEAPVIPGYYLTPTPLTPTP